ncbi:MAG: diguanylate cyclase [Kineosporiaceae bacterium]
MPDQGGPVLVVLDHVDPYQARVIAGIREVLDHAGLPALVHTVDPFAKAAPESLCRLLSGARISAVISTWLATPEVDEGLARLLEPLLGRVPVVHVSTAAQASSRVQVDNEPGMRALMRHLLDEAQVRRPVLLLGRRHQPDTRARERVIREELAHRGFDLDEGLVLAGDFDRDVSYRSLSDLLMQRRDFDSVIAFNDRSAIGALDALHEFGVRVPHDVVVSGFDDEEAAALLDTPLTTVDQDLHGQGVAAARLVLRGLSGEELPELVSVPTRLVLRESTCRGPVVPVPRSQVHFRSEMAHLDTTLAINRAFSACRSVADIVTVLADSLPRLGVTRGFLVLYDRSPVTGPVGRLAMRFRDRRALPVDDEDTFDLADLLPEEFADDLLRGTLVQQPLSVDGEEMGYLLFEQAGTHTFAGEVLWLDLNRALETVVRTQRLGEYAEQLERLVARRTEQLEAEVVTRRRAEADLQRANAELRRSLFLDGLTRIANRTALDETLAQQWQDLTVNGEELSMALVDVDHFKAYNDRYGHLRGDDCLRVIASCLTEAVRGSGDLVARYGGEEFAVLLPGTDEAGALIVAERVRKIVNRAALPHGSSPVAPYVTVSLGVATVHPEQLQRVDRLIARADEALYRAKADGRDRVVAWRPEMASPETTEQVPGGDARFGFFGA